MARFAQSFKSHRALKRHRIQLDLPAFPGLLLSALDIILLKIREESAAAEGFLGGSNPVTLTLRLFGRSPYGLPPQPPAACALAATLGKLAPSNSIKPALSLTMVRPDCLFCPSLVDGILALTIEPRPHHSTQITLEGPGVG
jgi:hypothetical protein